MMKELIVKDCTPLHLSDNAVLTLKKRYLKKNMSGDIIETPEDMFYRVAENIASAETTAELKEKYTLEFYKIMASLEFLPNSPTLMNAGRKLQQLSGCFVLPVEDSISSIFGTLKNSAMIFKSGGGVGYNFSRLRPKNSMVNSTKGIASGPVSFMRIFNTATDVIKQGGTRRGASIAILCIDHPDIDEFITCKQQDNSLNNFNISIAVTDNFMEAVEKDTDYYLIDPTTRTACGSRKARDIFNLIAKNAHANGEPGIIFIDEINRKRTTEEKITSTNPCGEIPLLDHESCNLGSINLSKFVTRDTGTLQWVKLGKAIETAVRFLDNVITMNNFPLPEIKSKTEMHRKIGLGIMGFADALALLGIRYDSEQCLQFIDELMSFIDHTGKCASEALGKEKGFFPGYDPEVCKFDSRRNATVTTVAPTGTISIIADCSSGIEPYFALAFQKKVLDGETLTEYNKYVFDHLRSCTNTSDLMSIIKSTGSLGTTDAPQDIKDLFRTASEISPEWHVKIQARFQKYVHNSISKTINMDSSSTVDDVRDVLLQGHALKCKGLTVYRDGSRSKQVLVINKADEKTHTTETTDKTHTTETTDKARMFKRPSKLDAIVCKKRTGCGNLYITVSKDESGNPVEIFVNAGKAGGCETAQGEGLSRMISLALRSGVKVESVIKHLINIRCGKPEGIGRNCVESCVDAIAKTLINFKTNLKLYNRHYVKPVACPECRATLQITEGCFKCPSCGYSKCE